MYSPVTFTFRVALRDDVLPLSKPYVDGQGNSRDTIPCVHPQSWMFVLFNTGMDQDTQGDDRAHPNRGCASRQGNLGRGCRRVQVCFEMHLRVGTRIDEYANL